jgi:hypothetical protein
MTLGAIRGDLKRIRAALFTWTKAQNGGRRNIGDLRSYGSI